MTHIKDDGSGSYTCDYCGRSFDSSGYRTPSEYGFWDSLHFCSIECHSKFKLTCKIDPSTDPRPDIIRHIKNITKDFKIGSFQENVNSLIGCGLLIGFVILTFIVVSFFV